MCGVFLSKAWIVTAFPKHLKQSTKMYHLKGKPGTDDSVEKGFVLSLRLIVRVKCTSLHSVMDSHELT